MFEVTDKFLFDNRTRKGGYTKKQIKALGISWPTRKGWKKKVIGQTISDRNKQLFISGKEEAEKPTLSKVKQLIKLLNAKERLTLKEWLSSYE